MPAVRSTSGATWRSPTSSTPGAREQWDAAELGPIHRRARALARNLLAAREGRLDPRTELGPPAGVVTSLPLAWSVELAVRAGAAGCPDGRTLLRALAAWLPEPTRHEVEWLVTHGDPSGQDAAAGLLEDLRDHSGNRSASRCSARCACGWARSRHRARSFDAAGCAPSSPCSCSGARCDANGSATCSGPTSSRPRPPRTSGSPSAACVGSSNRTGPAGQPTERIRSPADSIELAGPPLVDTDLGRFHRCVATADQAQRIGDSTEEAACLARAVDLWRGEPLVDLASIEELERRGRVPPTLPRRPVPAARRTAPRRRPLRRVTPLRGAERPGVAVLRAGPPPGDRLPPPAPRPRRTGVRRAARPRRCSPTSGSSPTTRRRCSCGEPPPVSARAPTSDHAGQGRRASQ